MQLSLFILQDVARPNTESKPNKKEEFLDLLNGSESAFEDHKNNSKKDDKRQKMQRKRSWNISNCRRSLKCTKIIPNIRDNSIPQCFKQLWILYNLEWWYENLIALKHFNYSTILLSYKPFNRLVELKSTPQTTDNNHKNQVTLNQTVLYL